MTELQGNQLIDLLTGLQTQTDATGRMLGTLVFWLQVLTLLLAVVIVFQASRRSV